MFNQNNQSKEVHNLANILRRSCKIAKAPNSCVMSVCLFVWNNSALTRQSILKVHIWVFLVNLSRELKFHWNLTRLRDTIYDDQYIFLIIFRPVPLRILKFSEKSVERIKNTHFVFIIVFRKSCRFRNNVENFLTAGRPKIILRMRTACWTPNATNTRSEYVIFIDFRLQRWLLLLQTNKIATSNVHL